MIRESRFLISRKPFAIDLYTVTARQVKRGDSNPYFNLSGQANALANALWIRRQKGSTGPASERSACTANT